MRVRFQADADLDGRILRGLRRAVPEIDMRTADDAALEGLKDSEVLRIAADSARILVSQDRRTMPKHFARFTAGAESPGVILLREATPSRPRSKSLFSSGIEDNPQLNLYFLTP